MKFLSDEQKAEIIKLASPDITVEEIAELLGHTIPRVRGVTGGAVRKGIIAPLKKAPKKSYHKSTDPMMRNSDVKFGKLLLQSGYISSNKFDEAKELLQSLTTEKARTA